jgi:alpha-D-xyloside xylohydrolase
MIRRIASWRMSFLPYYYSAFHRYRREGLPPTRALVLEFPEDPYVWTVDNAFMFGDNLLVAPFLGEACSRKVYFPQGNGWIDMQTNIRYAGGKTHTFNGAPGDVPVFVKENTLLPVAKPVQHVANDTVFDITVRVYGEAPGSFTLYEDDGETFDFEKGALNLVSLTWHDGRGSVQRTGNHTGRRYRITAWQKTDIRAPEEDN